MIEIDAINTSLFALSFICWISWWLRERSPWMTWCVPWLLLGLSLLAKGPVAVAFFYALLLPVLWRTARLRELLTRHHTIGVLLMLTVFSCWGIPLLYQLGAAAPAQTWTEELSLPIAGRKQLGITHWLLNLPRGVALFLPAALLLPFVRLRQIDDARLRESARALANAALIIFTVVLLLPGSYPKYVMPLIPVMCWLIGVAVAHHAFAWRLGIGSRNIDVPPRLVIAAVSLFALVAVIALPLQAATFPEARQRVKRNADVVNAAVPAGEPLYVIDSPYESFLFYIRAPLRYVDSINDLPPDARYFLMRTRHHASVAKSTRWPSPPRMVAQTDAPARHTMAVYAIESP